MRSAPPRRWPGVVSLVSGRLYLGGLELCVVADRVRVRLSTWAEIEVPVTTASLRALRGVVALWARMSRRLIAARLRYAAPTASTVRPGDTIQWALPLPGPGSVPPGSQRAWGATTGEITHLQLLDTTPTMTPERLSAAAGAIRRARPHDRAIDDILRSALGELKPWWDTPLRPRVPTHAELMAGVDDEARRWVRPMRDGRPCPWERATHFGIHQDTMTGTRYWVTVPDLAFALDLERANRPTVTMRVALHTGPP
jgi:hypothetical protein